MQTGLMNIELPILVSPDRPWSGINYRTPRKQFFFAPGAIYIVIGTRVTAFQKNWMQFDFVLIDDRGGLCGIRWGAPREDDIRISYGIMLRSFHPIR